MKQKDTSAVPEYEDQKLLAYPFPNYIKDVFAFYLQCKNDPSAAKFVAKQRRNYIAIIRQNIKQKIIG